MPWLTIFSWLFLANWILHKNRNVHNTHVKQETVYHTVSNRRGESSSEANRSRASQEIPQIFGTLRERYLLHSQQSATCPYPEPDQSSPYNPSTVLKIHFNNILPSMPRSYKWFPVPHQNPVYTSPLPHVCHMPHPSHSSSSDQPNNIWWEVQIMRILIMWTPAQTCVTTHPNSPCLISYCDFSLP